MSIFSNLPAASETVGTRFFKERGRYIPQVSCNGSWANSTPEPYTLASGGSIPPASSRIDWLDLQVRNRFARENAKAEEARIKRDRDEAELARLKQKLGLD